MAIHYELNDENFTTTYEAHADHIRGVLVNRGCPRDLLDDVSQEVAMRIWVKRHLYSDGSLKAWIAMVAERVWFNYHKTKIASEPQMVRLSQLADHGDSPVQDADFYPAAPSPEDAMILKVDLAKLLTSAEHELLMLELEGLTHRQIGAQLGASEAAIRSRLFRVRDKLRRAGVNSYAARPSGERDE